MISRVLGLVRESCFAAVFGISALASGFGTAFLLPNLFRRLLAEGGMTGAFVPTLNDELAKRERGGAFVLVNQVTSWLFVVTLAVSVLAMALLSWEAGVAALARLCGQDEAAIARWLLAAKLAVVLFPYLIFVCLAAVFSATLQTLNRFLEPALSPIWLNMAMIGLLVAGAYVSDGSDTGRMNWFCGGVLFGGFLQMAVPAWALTREGWQPRFDLTKSAQVKAIVALMVPTILGSAVYLINMTVSRFVGLSLNDAAVSILNYATRLMELPIGVFAVAVSTVIFPLISRHAAEGNLEQLALSYRKGMRLILLINLPAAMGLALLATPIIRLFFQHGAFAAEGTRMMTPVLAVYALGLPFFSFVNLVLRAFYAQKDTKTPVQAAVLSFAVNLGLSFALMKPLSIVGLAVAGNVAIVAQAWYLQARLTARVPGLAFAHLLPDLGRIVLATAAMGGVVAAGWQGWTRLFPDGGKGSDAAGLAALIAVGVGTYGALMWVLLPPVERTEVLGLLRRRRRAMETGGQG